MGNNHQSLETQNKPLMLTFHNTIFLVNQDSLSSTQLIQTAEWQFIQLLSIPDVTLLEPLMQNEPSLLQVSLSDLS